MAKAKRADKTSAQNRAVKKKGKPVTKKSVKPVAGKMLSTRSAVSSASVTSKKPRLPRGIKKVFPEAHWKGQPEWRITLVFGTATGTYGLATDQRIYRWNHRSALWVLHKEGLSATQQ